MKRNKLKTYAPQARRDFIAAVTERAAFHGLTAQEIVPIVEQGDVATARVQTWGYMDGFEAIIVPNSAGAGIEGESQEFLKECDADTWLEERINNLSQEGDEKIEGYIMPKKIFVPKPA